MKCKNCDYDIPEDSKFCPNCGFSMDSNPKVILQKKFNLSLKGILLTIAIGIWILVFQNLGIIPVNQDVKVKNAIRVTGTVDVGNPVDVNLQYINGHSSVFFNNPRRGEEDKYYVIPVSVE